MLLNVVFLIKNMRKFTLKNMEIVVMNRKKDLCLMKILEKWKIVIFPLCLILIIIICMWLFSILSHFDFLNGNKEDSIVDINALAIIILTIALVTIAWIQLSALNKITKSDFLLRITERYGSPELLEARRIIQEFYIETKEEKITYNDHIDKIANKIKELGKANGNYETKNFIYLINFLDFLETVAFFYSEDQNEITQNQVHDLLQHSLVYYFKVFKPWIYYRRLKFNDPEYQRPLENLSRKIEKDTGIR